MNKIQRIWMWIGLVLLMAGVVMNWYSEPPELGLKLYIGSISYMLATASIMLFVMYQMIEERLKKLEADHEQNKP